MALSSKPPRPSSRRQQSPQANSSSSNSSSTANSGNGKNLGLFLSDSELQNQFMDRFLYLIVNSIGTKFKCLTNSNVTIEGVLQNIDFADKTFKIYVELDNGVNAISYDDLIDFELENVNLHDPVKEQSSSFRTDTDISSRNKTGSNNNRERDIEKWTPEPDSRFDLKMVDDGKSWDQFQTNEEKFGIKSSFDENLYTTTIDRSNPKYHALKQKADKLAAEIEGSSYAGNSHVSEERGVKFDDSGLDEEDKYSGVSREVPVPKASSPTGSSVNKKGEDLFNQLMNKKNVTLTFNSTQDKPTKYVPPSQKKHLENIDPAVVSSQKPAQATTLKTAKHNKPHELSSTLTSNPAPQLINKANAKIESKFNNISEINSLREFAQNFKIPETFTREKKGGFIPIHAEKMKQIGSGLVDDSKAAKAATTEKPNVQESSSSKTKAAEPAKPKEAEKTAVITPPTKTEPTTASTTTATPTPVTTATTSPVISEDKEPKSAAAADSADDKKSSLPHHHKLNPKAAIFTPVSNKSSPVISSANLSKQSPPVAVGSPKVSHSANSKRMGRSSDVVHFFGQNKSPSSTKPTVYSNINFFASSLKAYEESKAESESSADKPFQIEMPFVTPPTWSTKDEVSENTSYKTYLATLTPSSITSPQLNFPQQQQQHQQQYQPQHQQQYIMPPHMAGRQMQQIPNGPHMVQHFPNQFVPQFMPPFGLPQNGNPRFMQAGANAAAMYHPGPPPPAMMNVNGMMGVPPFAMPHMAGPGGFNPQGGVGGPDNNSNNNGNNNGNNSNNNRSYGNSMRGNNSGNGNGYRRNH
ncbi:hypothetical protein WICPIJ_002164 [Wickerhamomyces pijperi]|uniref:LsmAD domain-containing protein n=1 Tax=Wickerhamomyces pijperi TaxID=599730 RepID=A0A9P8Q9G3_WICPI|nr:hypothetical protein WICPIJ_002164 [Wickerhamomyces pijperi]